MITIRKKLKFDALINLIFGLFIYINCSNSHLLKYLGIGLLLSSILLFLCNLRQLKWLVISNDIIHIKRSCFQNWFLKLDDIVEVKRTEHRRKTFLEVVTKDRVIKLNITDINKIEEAKLLTYLKSKFK